MITIDHPPFCANAACEHHGVASGSYTAFRPHGSYRTALFGLVRRFRCASCGSVFSSQRFSLDYFAKRIIPYPEFEEALASSMSTRALSRRFHVSTGTVANRVDRLMRQAIATHLELRSHVSRDEAFAADGFESFDVSQYFPNNITILVGTRSRFLYDASHVSLRRKGRMTDGQRRHRAKIDKASTYERDGVKRSFVDILRTAVDSWNGSSLVLSSDEHPAYPRAIGAYPVTRHLALAGLLVHERIPSTDARTGSNPLFPVNYMDRELRKDLANHRRETACFTRNASNGMGRFAVYLHYRNYHKAFMIQGSGPVVADDRDGPGLHPSHARMAGIPLPLLGRSHAAHYRLRAWRSRCDLPGFWRSVWEKTVRFPLACTGNHVPRYALE